MTSGFIKRIRALDDLWMANGSYNSIPELLMYLAEEVGEVAKEVRLIFRDRTGRGSKDRAELEIGDLMLNAFLIADKLGIDPLLALGKKLDAIESISPQMNQPRTRSIFDEDADMAVAAVTRTSKKKHRRKRG